MFRSRTKAGVTRQSAQDNPPSTTQRTEQIAAQSSSEREPLSSPCTRDSARTAPRSNLLGLAAQVRSVFFALALVVTTLVVGSGEAFGGAGRLIKIGSAVGQWPPTTPLRHVNTPDPWTMSIPPIVRHGQTGPRTWPEASGLIPHVFNVDLSNNGHYPDLTSTEPSTPRLKGGGHSFDVTNPDSLPGWLATLAHGHPGQYPDLLGDDLSLIVRRHYGIGQTLGPLPRNRIGPDEIEAFVGQVTQNMLELPNGVIIVDLPRTAIHQKTLATMETQLNSGVDLFVTGMPPTAKTLYPIGTTPSEVLYMLWSIQNDPSAIVSGKNSTILTGRCRVPALTLRVQGYASPTKGIQSAYPVFNQDHIHPRWAIPNSATP